MRPVWTTNRAAQTALSCLAALTGLAAAGAHCSRNSSPPSPTVTPAPGAPAPAAPVGTAAQPAQAAAPPPTIAASGPSANLNGEHHVVTVALAPPAAVPGEGALTVEVRATGGFHMNELYPSGLRLSATNATAPAEVRRAQAAEATQQRLAFRVPVQVTAAGPTLRGTARFAVCSAENCIPQTQDFAVNLP